MVVITPRSFWKRKFLDYFIFPKFLELEHTNKRQPATNLSKCIIEQLVAERRSLKGQGVLCLKDTEMRQSRSKNWGFGRVILKDLCRYDGKVFMDVD